MPICPLKHYNRDTLKPARCPNITMHRLFYKCIEFVVKKTLTSHDKLFVEWKRFWLPNSWHIETGNTRLALQVDGFSNCFNLKTNNSNNYTGYRRTHIDNLKIMTGSSYHASDQCLSYRINPPVALVHICLDSMRCCQISFHFYMTRWPSIPP